MNYPTLKKTLLHITMVVIFPMNEISFNSKDISHLKFHSKHLKLPKKLEFILKVLGMPFFYSTFKHFQFE